MAGGLVHRVVTIGDTSVGKTSIINQFIHNVFNKQQPTVGIESFARKITVGDQTVQLQIWDTAGQERFHSLIPSYVRNSTVAIFVYDITSRQTFDALKQWHKLTLNLANPAIVVVANKVDLESQRVVQSDEGRQYAESIGAQYFETSAVTALNVQELFQAIAEIPASVPLQAVESQQPIVQKIDLEQIAAPTKAGGCAC
jgi:Ras-related protein Rab-6A